MLNKGFGQIFIFMGSIMAYLIGSGFSSGQELMQYYVPHGYKGVLVGVTVIVILSLVNFGFAYAGNKQGFVKGAEVFEYYCGPIFGKVFDWFSVFFCFMLFVAMVAGAGSTLMEQYGLPLVVGAIIAFIMVGITVSFGLDSVVKVIGGIGPVLTGLVLIVGVITLYRTGGNIGPNMAKIASGEIELMEVSGNWFFSGLSITGLIVLMLSGFSAQLGSEHNIRTLLIGQTLGIVLYAGVCILMSFALIANVDVLADKQIPNLVLASDIWPVLGTIFGVIIFLAIYTTCCPLIWTAASRFSTEGSARFKMLTWVLSAAGTVVAVAIPFNVLINYVYKITGYVGAAIIFFMIIKLIRMGMDKTKNVTE